MKKRLASKGTKGFLSFEKALKHADTDNDNLLTFDQFKQVIKEQRIDITSPECNIIFDVFDEQQTGFINFSELIYTIKGKMPEERRYFSDKLWHQLMQS
jgi:Ca2+-binding EF-hand superfamily protein